MEHATPDPAETERLLEQIQSGDRQAFDHLLASYRPYLRRLIQLRLDSRLGARLDVSDVIQETHLEALRRLDSYLERRPLPFTLWLRQTACERLLMLQRFHLKAQRRSVNREVALPDQSSVQLGQQILAGHSTPSQQVSREELAQRVSAAMSRLAETDREVLIMRHLEGLTNGEVAQALNIESVAASQRYGRALLRLRKLLVPGESPEE
jgi:RNA polymerase sigma-70 factor (ECF subfamily)